MFDFGKIVEHNPNPSGKRAGVSGVAAALDFDQRLDVGSRCLRVNGAGAAVDRHQDLDVGNGYLWIFLEREKGFMKLDEGLCHRVDSFIKGSRRERIGPTCNWGDQERTGDDESEEPWRTRDTGPSARDWQPVIERSSLRHGTARAKETACNRHHTELPTARTTRTA
jgi:hypothetical protein